MSRGQRWPPSCDIWTRKELELSKVASKSQKRGCSEPSKGTSLLWDLLLLVPGRVTARMDSVILLWSSCLCLGQR
eukprot:3550667-Amphidinium_carterae.1